jgi:hypothetical protein
VLFVSLGLAVWNMSAAEGGTVGNFSRIVTGDAQPFATLPQIINSSTMLAEGHPEGLCADSAGNVYADSFEQPIGGPGGTYVQNFIYKFAPNGNLVSATPTKTGVVPLGCIVSGSKFYMNDVYNGDEYQYTLPLTASSVPTKVFHICGGFTGQPGPLCALNANYPGPDGNIYMSDNGAALFGDLIGRIWVLNPTTGVASIFLDSSAGATAIAVADLPIADYVPTGATLPYGPNGVAFSRDGKGLYIANMSTNIIYKQAVKDCSGATGCQPDGAITQFSNDPLHFIHGPDNMDFDDHGNLWIASGQVQHVVVLGPLGKVIGLFGAFDGFTSQGAPIGLLQPSGIIFSNDKIYIGNESNQSLLPTSYDVDWAALKQFTISSVDADIVNPR